MALSIDSGARSNESRDTGWVRKLFTREGSTPERVSRVERRVDQSSSLVDARLPDGSRVNAAIPPVAVDGPLLSIRRLGTTGISPKFYERLKQCGIVLIMQMFQTVVEID